MSTEPPKQWLEDGRRATEDHEFWLKFAKTYDLTCCWVDHLGSHMGCPNGTLRTADRHSFTIPKSFAEFITRELNEARAAAAQARREGIEAALRASVEFPDKNVTQDFHKGFFSGVTAYAKAIYALLPAPIVRGRA